MHRRSRMIHIGTGPRADAIPAGISFDLLCILS